MNDANKADVYRALRAAYPDRAERMIVEIEGSALALRLDIAVRLAIANLSIRAEDLYSPHRLSSQVVALADAIIAEATKPKIKPDTSSGAL